MYHSDSQSSIIKFKYGPKLHKWRLRHHSDMTLNMMKAKVQYFFRIRSLKSISLRYMDSDGDWINLTDDDDLSLAVHTEPSLFVEVIVDMDCESQPRSPTIPYTQRSLEKLSLSSSPSFVQSQQFRYGTSGLHQQNDGFPPIPHSYDQPQSFLPSLNQSVASLRPSLIQYHQADFVPSFAINNKCQPDQLGMQSRPQQYFVPPPSYTSSVAGYGTDGNQFARYANPIYAQPRNRFYY
ncbi:PB1 domain-containing protein [Ditylenchus destructor]|nr:PB1 domain-containing protein [Ditylenchus destructor]